MLQKLPYKAINGIKQQKKEAIFRFLFRFLLFN